MLYHVNYIFYTYDQTSSLVSICSKKKNYPRIIKAVNSGNYFILQAGVWANSGCRYFPRLRSLKNAVSFSKVPKIIL